MNHAFETRGVAPGCYSSALSAPKPRINRAVIRVEPSHFFPNVMRSNAQDARYFLGCRIIALSP